jgi:hydrogenase expression/formation protein HypC
MCLAVPARVESIEGTTALVTAFGCQEKVDIQFVPSIKIGEFVLVHVGFALERIYPEDAALLLEAWDTMFTKGEDSNE